MKNHIMYVCVFKMSNLFLKSFLTYAGAVERQSDMSPPLTAVRWEHTVQPPRERDRRSGGQTDYSIAL